MGKMDIMKNISHITRNYMHTILERRFLEFLHVYLVCWIATRCCRRLAYDRGHTFNKYGSGTVPKKKICTCCRSSHWRFSLERVLFLLAAMARCFAGLGSFFLKVFKCSSVGISTVGTLWDWKA
jgi:hypothetical protein